MMQLKEKKDMDDQFKKVQKPWAKILAKVTKAKADYHNACKAEKTAINQVSFFQKLIFNFLIILIIFSNLQYNFSSILDLRNMQENAE